MREPTTGITGQQPTTYDRLGGRSGGGPDQRSNSPSFALARKPAQSDGVRVRTGRGWGIGRYRMTTGGLR